MGIWRYLSYRPLLFGPNINKNIKEKSRQLWLVVNAPRDQCLVVNSPRDHFIKDTEISCTCARYFFHLHILLRVANMILMSILFLRLALSCTLFYWVKYNALTVRKLQWICLKLSLILSLSCFIYRDQRSCCTSRFDIVTFWDNGEEPQEKKNVDISTFINSKQCFSF